MIVAVRKLVEKMKRAIRTEWQTIDDPFRDTELWIAELESALAAESPVCTVPPVGWHCTRKPGHDGPCAAVPSPDPERCKCGPHRRPYRETHRALGPGQKPRVGCLNCNQWDVES